MVPRREKSQKRPVHLNGEHILIMIANYLHQCIRQQVMNTIRFSISKSDFRICANKAKLNDSRNSFDENLER